MSDLTKKRVNIYLKAMKKSSKPRSVKKIFVVGQHNSGKSQVFNNLTGEYALVANSPLTTIEIKSGNCRIEGQLFFDVVDTPGLHSLSIHKGIDSDGLSRLIGIPVVETIAVNVALYLS